MTVGKTGQERQKVQKTYGKIIYRGTMNLMEMAEHISKHGSVYTEDVVVGVITKLKTCIQEMLADGYKVKLDGIGTLYPVVNSEGVADAKDYSASDNITRVSISFMADQSKKSIYKASAMKQETKLSTKLYSELTGENEDEEEGSENGSSGSNGSGSGSGTNQDGGGGSTGGNTNQGDGSGNDGGGFDSGD